MLQPELTEMPQIHTSHRLDDCRYRRNLCYKSSGRKTIIRERGQIFNEIMRLYRCFYYDSRFEVCLLEGMLVLSNNSVYSDTPVTTPFQRG